MSATVETPATAETGGAVQLVEYDPTGDIVYLHLTDRQAPAHVARTEDLGGLRHVDYAADGTVLGVELLSPRTRGVDLTDVPAAAEIGAELRRLGFRVHGPAETTGP